jgi:D-xylose transport system substrate-binding protein
LKVPVSGQDASPAGLQNVLLGKQTTTVWKPYTLIATAASDLAIALLNGESPTADKTLADGTPYIAVTPNSVGQAGVKDVVAAGDAKYDEVCTAAVKAACDEFGVTA